MTDKRHSVIFAGLLALCACTFGGCSAEPTAADLVKDMMTQINERESGIITWSMDMSIAEDSTGEDSQPGAATDDENGQVGTESGEKDGQSGQDDNSSGSARGVHLSGASQYSTPDGLTESQISVSLPETDSDLDCHIISKEDDKEVRYVWNGSQWYKISAAARGQTVCDDLLQLIRDYSDTMFVTSGDTVSIQDADNNTIECLELTAPVTPEDMMLLRADWLGQLDFPIGDQQEAWDIYAGSDYSLDMSGQLTVLLDQDTHEIVRMELETNPLEIEYAGEDAESETTEESLTVSAVTESDVDAAVAALDTETTWSTASFTLEADFTFPESVSIEIPEEALQAGPVPEAIPEAEEEEDPSLVTEAAEEEILAQFGETEQEMCSGENIAVYLTKISKTTDDKVFIGLHLVNGSDRQMEIYSVGTALNSTMFEKSSIYEVVPAGGTKDTVMMIENVSLYGIDNVGSVSIRFEADDTNGFNVFDSQVCSYVLDPESQDYVIPENETASVIYENDLIRVTALAPVQDGATQEVPMFIENLSDSTWSLSGEQMTSPDGIAVDGTLYGDLFPHTYLYTCLNLNLDDMNLSGYPIPDQVKLVITVYDSDSMKALFTTESFNVSAFDSNDTGTDESAAEDYSDGSQDADVTDKTADNAADAPDATGNDATDASAESETSLEY